MGILRADNILSGRWLFIVDGIITLPLAVAGFVFFPNLPQGGKKTWWTTQEEHELSIRRMQAVGREGKQPWTKAKVKKILLSWQTYLLRKSNGILHCTFICHA
jgi:MFS transporter, ACS family, pantothenate transporter